MNWKISILPKAEKDLVKSIHMSTLRELYEPKRFKGAERLDEEREKFLTEVQGVAEVRVAQTIQ